ncbi:cullin domain containing [Cryptosporidium sp. chipmunk genotype I]|uniref:cullin domain containing n=1 Tax=Cryptosporidium sp. chipmunk genotype I TaxID=1280935 RepID=UPI00351A0B0F|nr:cullin domain containing [Cryptosporidium sp. chipmunk genotype I]
MITENFVVDSLCESSTADNFSELSEQVLEAWVMVSVSARSFVSDINKILDENLYNSKAYEQVEDDQKDILSGFEPSPKFTRSKLQLERLISTLETPEITDALDCIYRNGLSIQLLESFLGHSLDYVISKEITFFWTTLLLLGQVDATDSRITSNDTNSVDGSLSGNKDYLKESKALIPMDRDILSFHSCLVFGLVRLLWNIVFILYGAVALANIPHLERNIFLYDCLSPKDQVFPNNLSECPLRRVIHGFMTKIRLLFKESIPPGFDVALERYILGIITFLSEKILKSDEFSIKNEISPIIMREYLLRVLINNSCGDTKKRMEICKSRLEGLQHLYEHKASRVLSLNGSFPSNLDFETLELLLSLIGCSNSVEKCLGQLNSSLIGNRNIGEESGGKNNAEDRDYWDSKKIQDILRVISRGPILEDLNRNVEEYSLEALSMAHTSLLDELIWLVFCSEEQGRDYVSSESSQITLMTRIGDLPVLMRLVGFEHMWKQRVVSLLKIQSANAVMFLEKRNAEESNLRIYSKYVHEFMGSILMGLLDGGFGYIKARDLESVDQENVLRENSRMLDFQVDNNNNNSVIGKEFEPLNSDLTFQMIFEEFYMEYNWSLKRRVVDLIAEFPMSKSSILDLYITMNYFPSSNILREVWYSEISREILNYVNGKLLHLHVETSMIVGFYVKSIIFLLMLDFPNDWMDKTLTRFGDALRQRGDTTLCIVSWMPLMLENCSPALSDSEIIMPISCSDEGVYPQFSISNPNYRNECRGLFEKSFDQIQDYSQSFHSPQIKLVLSWISHIYGSNLTLLYDYIFNLASRVIGSGQDVGFESSSLDGTEKGSLVDENTWEIDEKRFQKDESVFEMIKLTMGGRSGNNLLKGGSAGSKFGSKDEQQLLTNCSIILQDISSSILDNKEYSNFKEGSRIAENSKPTVTGFTISRNYWSESVINMEIRDDKFPLAPVLKDEIEEYKRFFEREHPGRTFNCYSRYGVGLVDLTAIDGTVKTRITLNFLQISIYDYISSKHSERSLDYSESGASKDGILDSDKLISSNSILNWFTISPKATDRSSDRIDKVLAEEVRVTFADLLNHFRLDEQTVRWSIENMLSRGIIQIVNKEEGLEYFDIPQTFSNTKLTREAGGREEQEQGRDMSLAQTNEIFSGTNTTEEGFCSSINDMTVMLDFSNMLNNRNSNASLGGFNCQRSGYLKKSFTLSNLMETPKRDSYKNPEEASSERARKGGEEGTAFDSRYLATKRNETEDQDILGGECDEGEEDEDLNLNFPTGIITTTISFKGKDLIQDTRRQGSTASRDGLSCSSKKGESKPGKSASGGNLPPMIGFSETYLEKYCYFTTPSVLDQEDHGFDSSSPGNGRFSKEREHANYDIIKECELLIRATLQLNGAMAPAVLFGRVRAAIASQGEDKSSQKDSSDHQGTVVSTNPDTQYTLTWPQHVQAINNMVDRGEVYNKGGRLFLEK